ncbi:MAG TPA: glycosyl transferase [Sorangium sp.]|nr:glycosyl transferase [Sorangium sp.]
MPSSAVRFTKRLLDIASASFGLALTLPLFPLVALAIRRDSPGPIFYSQKRARALLERRPGDRQPRCSVFTMYKFRTMRTDAEKGTGAVFAAKGDPRVTAVGKLLRRTRIDELPQLWNVLIGDMSLVGPRPERPEILVDLALAIPFFEERIRDVKPGLTGLAQVSLGYTGEIPNDSELAPFRAALQNPFKLDEAEGAVADDLRAKLLYDLAYSASLESLPTYLATEARIILKTPLVMVLGLGR